MLNIRWLDMSRMRATGELSLLAVTVVCLISLVVRYCAVCTLDDLPTFPFSTNCVTMAPGEHWHAHSTGNVVEAHTVKTAIEISLIL